MLGRGRPLVVPGCGDAISALAIERAGFEVAFLSGFWCAAVRGLLDVGLIGLSELADTVRSITTAASIPVLCDADTGFGESPVQLRRCISELEAAGAAGLTIEDQIFAKRCGLTEGKRIIPRDAMVKKLLVATEARSGPDFVIIARTDSLENEGIPGAIERGHAYLQAGADLLFVEGFTTIEEVTAIAAVFPGNRLVFNRTPPGYAPQLSLQELQHLGFGLVMLPVQLLLVALFSQQRALEEIRERGYCYSLDAQMATIDQVSALLGQEEMAALEDRHES